MDDPEDDATNDLVIDEDDLESQVGIQVKIKKEHKCQDCGEAFYLKQALEDHIDNTHQMETVDEQTEDDVMSEDELNNLSSNSQKIGGQSTDSTKHQIKAYNQKQIRCTDCNEKFASKDSLRMHHEAIHQGVKRYFCEKCDFGCYRKDNFEKHTSKIHCSACSFTTSNQEVFDQHLAMMHTDLAPEDAVPIEPKIEIFEPEPEKFYIRL